MAHASSPSSSSSLSLSSLSSSSSLIEGLDTEDRQYYDQISQLTVTLIMFTIIYTLVYTQVYRWLSRTEARAATPRHINVQPSSSSSSPPSSSSSSSSSSQSSEYYRAYLSFLLCVFVASVMVMWVVTTVAVVAATYDASRYHRALQWLTTQYVSRLWAHLAWITSLSACVVAPFAYLYYESEGFHPQQRHRRQYDDHHHQQQQQQQHHQRHREQIQHLQQQQQQHHHHLRRRQNSTCSRVAETMVVLVLFVVSVYGVFHLLWSLWIGGEQHVLVIDPWSSTLLTNMGLYMPGLMACLWSVHRGFSELIWWSALLRVPWTYRQELRETVEAHDLQLVHLHALLQAAPAPAVGSPLVRSKSGAAMYEYDPLERRPLRVRERGVEERIARITDARADSWAALVQAQRCTNHPVVRNSMCVVLVSVTLLMTWHIMARALWHEVVLLTEVLTSPDSIVRTLMRAITAPLRFIATTTTTTTTSTVAAATTTTATATATATATTAWSWSSWSWSIACARLLIEFSLGADAHWPPMARAGGDIVLTLYFLLAVYMGVGAHVEPRLGRLKRGRTQILLVRFTLGLLVTAALPVATWTIGLARYDMAQVHAPAAIMHDSPLLLHTLNVSFLALFVWYLVDFWWRYVVIYYGHARHALHQVRESVAVRRACTRARRVGAIVEDALWRVIDVVAVAVNLPRTIAVKCAQVVVHGREKARALRLRWRIFLLKKPDGDDDDDVKEQD